MSLIGSFTFNNNDRTTERAGSGLPSDLGVIWESSRTSLDEEPSHLTTPKPVSRRDEQAQQAGSRPWTDQQWAALAKSITLESTISRTTDNPFYYKKDTTLDPNGPNFNARDWARSILKLNSAEQRRPGRTAGVSFQKLDVTGYGSSTSYQKTMSTVILSLFDNLSRLWNPRRGSAVLILNNFEGLVKAGEMLVVLGPPGSGCSTLLKCLSGETHGLKIGERSQINYQGISARDMRGRFRGEAIYNAEVDVHFPQLTVGDTLYFAARARVPQQLPAGVSKKRWAETLRDVVLAVYDISHTINTKVGNEFVRGVSGGERKRVSLAEVALCGAPLQAWDNSTRGLDSASSIRFCRTLRLGTDLFSNTACVAIYQAPQAAYELFDKVIVLYEGKQIFFGRCEEAKDYFRNLGFECPERMPTPDFLTSMTSFEERQSLIRAGFEAQVPSTAEDFASAWTESQQRCLLLQEILIFEKDHPISGETYEAFVASRKAQQARGQRLASPYTLSYLLQVQLCLWRGFKGIIADPSLVFTQLSSNFVLALVISSVFYNLASTTDSFYSRGALLFFAILVNAFGSAAEILTLYAQRPMVEKQARYALVHPSAEAFASSLADIPYKVGNAVVFNLTLYFVANLRREPGPFFFFLLVTFLLTLTIGSLILAIVIFTGFTIPTTYMVGWSRWINYIDPVAYGFESLMINEFHDRLFACSSFVPPYGSLGLHQKICSAVASKPGDAFVNGDDYINSAFGYFHTHKWRNVGIIVAFFAFFTCTYVLATEFVPAKRSKGEVLVFKRRRTAVNVSRASKRDIETGADGTATLDDTHTGQHANMDFEQTGNFHWQELCYEISIKGQPRQILSNVDGWVKPGTLTALMGVSGAGKTTLLDVLASRISVGVITGNTFVDGSPVDASFQRKTGYVQQQDLHLETTTVREALEFSAILRQSSKVSHLEKVAYVDEMIKLLDMENYADAVVGVLGEGLNVEQRKRLSIGVELVAKPELLLFLDEPTSGLDSQTSASICALLKKLAKSGQAILCTIHQPGALLFKQFDRLLLLAKGGRPVYFGDIGPHARTLIQYFERIGAPSCPPETNPAKWMLDTIREPDKDWHKLWRSSPEFQSVRAELEKLKVGHARWHDGIAEQERTAVKDSEFAASFGLQLRQVATRVFQQYWRTPSYLYSKAALCTLSSLFIGFSFFRAPNTQQGLQNQMFAVFMLMTIFGNLVQQIMPLFVTQRSLYEARERQSKTYSWQAFILSNIFVEIPWTGLMAVPIFFCLYYPVGLYRNAESTGGEAIHERGALFFLLTLSFLLFTCTFAHMVIAGVGSAETGGNIANLMFSMSLIFCGVLATPGALPGFWIFLYRVSPFTYLINGMLSTALANTRAYCASNEWLHFNPSSGHTCGQYLSRYIESAGGYVDNPEANSSCRFCQLNSTNTFLASVSSSYGSRWRNFGIMWAYIVFNIVAALALYWLARVPKKLRQGKKNPR